jgi:23S rRNA pseudouridine1911/1915/1917 synthase
MQASQPGQPDPLETTIQQDGVRIDKALARWRGLSRAAVWRLLDQGAVTCNGRALRRKHKGDPLRVGDRLSIEPGYAQGEAPLPDAIAKQSVIQAGEGWLVIDKPAGVPVRPHALDETGTVINAAVTRHPEMIGVGEGGLRSGVVHRLDTDTSGTLLIATEQSAWEYLRDAFSEHRITKRYLALVVGSPSESGEAQRDLNVASHRPARVEVHDAGTGPSDARVCSLSWNVIERLGDRASLIEVDLHTGFLHQVRAMMNALGHPVIGDRVYGDPSAAIDAPRQMLHAKSLAFEAIHAEAPMPVDMQQVLQSLRA